MRRLMREGVLATDDTTHCSYLYSADAPPGPGGRPAAGVYNSLKCVLNISSVFSNLAKL